MASPIPEVIQSLPPVTISHISEGPNPWLAFIGPAAISTVAVLIAVVTLIMVCRQIAIANRQLRVAYKELRAVNSDFRLAQKQFREITRRPRLDLVIELHKSSPEIVASSVFVAQLSVRNRGEKLSSHLRCEILVPVEDFQASGGGLTQKVAAVDDIARYMSLGLDWKIILYPDRTTSVLIFSPIAVKDNVETCELLFRLYDANFAYPPEDYGKVMFSRYGALQRAEYREPRSNPTQKD